MSKDVNRTQVLQNVRVRHALKKDGSWIHKSKDDKTDDDRESKPAVVRQKSYVMQTAKIFESVDSSPTSPLHQTAFLPSKGESANQTNGEVDKAQGELQLENSTVETGADTKSKTSTDQLSQNSSIPDPNPANKKEENRAPVDETNVEHCKEGVEISVGVNVEENTKPPSSASEDLEAVSMEPAEQPPTNKSAENKKEHEDTPSDIPDIYHSEAKVSTNTNVENTVTLVSDVGSTGEGNDTVEVPAVPVVELKPQEEFLLKTEPSTATNLADAGKAHLYNLQGSLEKSPPQQAEDDIVATATKVMVECETNDETGDTAPGEDLTPGDVATVKAVPGKDVGTGDDAAPGKETAPGGDVATRVAALVEVATPGNDLATEDAGEETKPEKNVAPRDDAALEEETAPAENVATGEAGPGTDVVTGDDVVSGKATAPGEDAARGEDVATGVAVLVEDAKQGNDLATGKDLASSEAVPGVDATPGDDVAPGADAALKVVAPGEDAAPEEDVATGEVAPIKDVVAEEDVATGEDAALGKDVATGEVAPGENMAPGADAALRVVTPAEDVARGEVAPGGDAEARQDVATGEDAAIGEDVATNEDAAPGEDVATKEDAAPGEDVATKEDAAPGEDVATKEDAAPGEEVATKEDAASGEDVATKEDAAPGEDVATKEDAAPGEEVATKEDAASGEDVATGKDAAPVEDAATKEDAAPGEDVATGELAPGEDVVTGEDVSVQVFVDSVPDLLVESVCKSPAQPVVETSAEGDCERFPPEDDTKETVEAVNEVEVKSLPVTAVDEATPGGEAALLNNVEPDPDTILEPPIAEPAVQSVESEVEIASSAEPILKSSAVEIIEREAQCVDNTIDQQNAEPTPEGETDPTLELNIEDAVKPVSDSDAESVKVNLVERAINLTDALDIETPTAEAVPEPVEHPEQSLPEESGLKQQCDATNSSEGFQKPAEEPSSTEATYTLDNGKASCSFCNQIIDGNVKISLSEPPVTCHPECLKCGVCAKALGDLLTSMFLHDKVIQCGGCFSKTLNI